MNQGEAMQVRPYDPEDHAACMKLFVDLIPDYFTPEEEADFEAWLNGNPAHYYVVVAEGQIIGCGGIAMEDDGKTATLCWGLIGINDHRRGVGSVLLRHRIEQFTAAFPQTERIRLSTSHKVHRFFVRHGFEVLKVDQDKIAPGLDLVEMEKRL